MQDTNALNTLIAQNLNSAIEAYYARNYEDFASSIDNIPPENRAGALAMPCLNGKSILMFTADTPAFFRAALNSLTDIEKGDAVTTPDSSGLSVLMRTAYNDESFMEALKAANEKKVALTVPDNDGQSALARIVDNPRLFRDVLESFSAEDQLTLLTTKNNNGTSVFMLSASYSGSFETALQIIPEKDRSDAVTEVDNFGRSALSRAAYNPRSLDMALSVIPEKNKLDELTARQDVFGHTPGSIANGLPESKPVADGHLGKALAASKKAGSNKSYNIGGINVYIPNLRNTLPKLSKDIQQSYHNTVSIYKIPSALAAAISCADDPSYKVTINVKEDGTGVDLKIKEATVERNVVVVKMNVKEGGTGVDTEMNEAMGTSIRDAISMFFRGQKGLPSDAIQQQYGRDGEKPGDFVKRLQKSADNPNGLCM